MFSFGPSIEINITESKLSIYLRTENSITGLQLYLKHLTMDASCVSPHFHDPGVFCKTQKALPDTGSSFWLQSGCFCFKKSFLHKKLCTL